MPELPEVESVRRGLVEAKLTAPVVNIWRSSYKLRTGKHWQTENLTLLQGARPKQLQRRGKYILWQFETPNKQPLALLIHLGMSGRCGVALPEQAKIVHTHLVLRFADDREFRFIDPRRFGGVRVATWEHIFQQPPLSELGPEPLDVAFRGALLAERLQQSSRCIRDALLDQQVVAGIGNIYAIEALYQAKIHPLVAARRLRDSAWDRLAKAIVHVLQQGIEHGGTTLKDFRNVVGQPGKNQDRLLVYGRAGKPCFHCKESLESFEHGGRNGVFCPREQVRPRSRWVE